MIEQNLYDIAQELDNEDYLPNVTYVESEGEDCIRIDYASERSVWLYKDGSTMGEVPPRAQKHLEKIGFIFE